MIKKSITTGLIIGLLLTLAIIYPVFLFFPGRYLSGDSVLVQLLSDVQVLGRFELPLNLIFILASTGLATLVCLFIGTLAAWRSGATCLKPGLAAGAISGLIGALTIYVCLVAPTVTVTAGQRLYEFNLSSNNPFYPEALIVPFARTVLADSFTILAAVLGIGLLVGAVQGGIVGFLRPAPKNPLPAPTLIDMVGKKRGRRIWFANAEEGIKAGLIAGLGAGAIQMLAQFLGSAQTSPGLPGLNWEAGVIQQVINNSHLGALSNTPIPWLLSPVSFLVAITVGGIAAFLPKNPSAGLQSRIRAGTVAGAVVGLMVSFPIADEFRFLMTVLPQYFVIQAAEPAIIISANPPLPADLVSSPHVRILLTYLLSILTPAVIVFGYAVWGSLQGLFYGWIFSIIRLRPVDRARVASRMVSRNPDLLLPIIYRIFQKNRSAMQIIEHMVFFVKSDPLKARLLAAYHSFGAHPESAAEAFDLITATLANQPAWKLSAEIGSLHAIMAQGLRAGSIAQITAISPTPEMQTTSLIPALAKAGQHISRPIQELGKVERVDDPATKLIFLNNSLEALRLARLFAEEGACRDCATLFPEIAPFKVLLNRWEDLVMAAIKDLQGKAELSVELKTRTLTFGPAIELEISIANTGLNVAEDVRFSVEPSPEDYDILEGAQQTITILPPQDPRHICFKLRPLHAGRMRISWKIHYDDSLVDDRLLEFGDQVEFLGEDRPFQRIFPIPYVTGTPLQSGQMFVGREDVFEFVKENLFGAYQNNVIVLHGQRRTGKSSILYRLTEALKETHVCVLVDMQGKAARGEVDFLYEIADDIVYTLENLGVKVELPPRQEFEESPEFFFRSRFLRSVTDCLDGKNLLLMFDEFEELQKRVEDGRLTREIFPYLRNLMQHEKKVDFIFAGTHKLEELAAEYWSILFNIAAYKKITFLGKEEVKRLATGPVQDFGLEYDPLALERIYQVANGHPYFTQVICHELVAYHNETQRSYLTNTDVEAAVDRIVERGEAHFKYIWAESSLSEKLALMALAELLEGTETATVEDIAAVLNKRGRPLDPAEIMAALKHLENRDILMRANPRSSLYRFRIDLVRRWLYGNRPSYEKVI